MFRIKNLEQKGLDFHTDKDYNVRLGKPSKECPTIVVDGDKYWVETKNGKVDFNLKFQSLQRFCAFCDANMIVAHLPTRGIPVYVENNDKAIIFSAVDDKITLLGEVPNNELLKKEIVRAAFCIIVVQIDEKSLEPFKVAWTDTASMVGSVDNFNYGNEIEHLGESILAAIHEAYDNFGDHGVYWQKEQANLCFKLPGNASLEEFRDALGLTGDEIPCVKKADEDDYRILVEVQSPIVDKIYERINEEKDRVLRDLPVPSRKEKTEASIDKLLGGLIKQGEKFMFADTEDKAFVCQIRDNGDVKLFEVSKAFVEAMSAKYPEVPLLNSQGLTFSDDEKTVTLPTMKSFVSAFEGDSKWTCTPQQEVHEEVMDYGRCMKIVEDTGIDYEDAFVMVYTQRAEERKAALEDALRSF